MIKVYRNLSHFYQQNIAFPILCILLFTLPFGSAFQVPWIPFIGEKAKLQTLLGFSYIGFGILFGLFIKGFKSYPYSIFFFVSIFLMIIGNLINAGISDFLDISKHCIFSFYIISMFLISTGIKISKKRLIFILLIFYLIVVFISLCTIIDLIGIVDFKKINQQMTPSSFFGFILPSINGFSSSKTDFSFIVALAIAINLFLIKIDFNKKNVNKNLVFKYLSFVFKKTKFFVKKTSHLYYINNFCFLILIITAILTYQRAILISILLSVITVKFLKKIKIRKLNLSLFIIFISIFLILIFSTSETYKFNFQDDASYRIRMNAYVQTFLSIKNNPFGIGYGLIEDEHYGMINPHNSYLFLILISGIYGFILFLMFIFPIFKELYYQRNNPFTSYLSLIILIWFFGQLFHTTIYSTFGWCYMGILVSYFKKKNYRVF